MYTYIHTYYIDNITIVLYFIISYLRSQAFRGDIDGDDEDVRSRKAPCALSRPERSRQS